jgi:hypothetical protein
VFKKSIRDWLWWQCAGELIDLIRSWWRVDRIRASPREGRLLRLSPPCILCIDAVLVEVHERVVGQTVTGPYVRYDCIGPDGRSELWVMPRGRDQTPEIHWIQGPTRRVLSEADIEAFNRRTSGPAL